MVSGTFIPFLFSKNLFIHSRVSKLSELFLNKWAKNVNKLLIGLAVAVGMANLNAMKYSCLIGLSASDPLKLFWPYSHFNTRIYSRLKKP